MAKRRIKFTFVQELIKEPIIWKLAKEFDVITNIRRANVTKDKGWVVEGRIPWEAFKPTGGRPKPGDRWKFALCRYDYSVAFDRPELSSCAPLTTGDFHRYEDYADLVFKDRE